MGTQPRGWLRRFMRWLFGAPFQKLPPQYGNTVPPEMQLFKAEAHEAEHRGLGKVASGLPAHDVKVKPARQDEALERQ